MTGHMWPAGVSVAQTALPNQGKRLPNTANCMVTWQIRTFTKDKSRSSNRIHPAIT